MSESEKKDLLSYFKMSEAVDDVKYSVGAKETTVSALKLVGKGLFNSAKFIIASAPKAMEEVSKQQLNQTEKQLKRKDLTSEERDRWQDLNEKAQNNYDRVRGSNNKS